MSLPGDPIANLRPQGRSFFSPGDCKSLPPSQSLPPQADFQSLKGDFSEVAVVTIARHRFSTAACSPGEIHLDYT
jgi:hypothetical protein